MTARYIGTDRDLLRDVLEARDDYAAEILDGILDSENLAGKLGQALVSRTSKFRGITGSAERAKQIRLLTENADMIVLPHRYGVCFYRSDVASCQGDRAKIGVNTCVGCKNFIVGRVHRDYWVERREELMRFKEGLPAALSGKGRVEALESEIAAAGGIISIIDGVPE